MLLTILLLSQPKDTSSLGPTAGAWHLAGIHVTLWFWYDAVVEPWFGAHTPIVRLCAVNPSSHPSVQLSTPCTPLATQPASITFRAPKVSAGSAEHLDITQVVAPALPLTSLIALWPSEHAVHCTFPWPEVACPEAQSVHGYNDDAVY